MQACFSQVTVWRSSGFCWFWGLCVCSCCAHTLMHTYKCLLAHMQTARAHMHAQSLSCAHSLCPSLSLLCAHACSNSLSLTRTQDKDSVAVTVVSRALQAQLILDMVLFQTWSYLCLTPQVPVCRQEVSPSG